MRNDELNPMTVEYPAKNSLSVWIGTFADEERMDICMDTQIEPSLGLSVPMSAICEVGFEAEVVPLRSLLEGFSGWQTFIDEACRAGKELRVGAANGALVCYHLRCDAPADFWTGLNFLGSFCGQDVC
jgi:hypothetical protein